MYSGVGADPALWVAAVLFATAITVFALGVGRGGSIVARRPVGVASLITFAIAPWLLMVAISFVPGGPVPGIALFYLVRLVTFAIGLVAVIAILRARVLPPVWRQIPLWAFVVATLTEIAEAFRFFYGATTWYHEVVSLEIVFALPVVIPGVILVLGILAVVLGARIASGPATVAESERRPAGTV